MKKASYTDRPLTKEEKIFAEKNHNLIYGFLHKRGYSIEEYYQIAVFGFLKAVEIYHRKPDIAEKYDFPYVAWQYMRAEINDHVKKEKANKRKSTENIISLDAESDDLENLYNTIGGKLAETSLMENVAIYEVMEKLSEIQQKIAMYKMDGFSNKEICILLEIPSSSFYMEMKRIKSILENFRI